MRRLTFALILMLPSLPCLAQTVRGLGARPCGDWTQARQSGGRDFEAEQWALGYISAVSAGRADNAGAFRNPDERTVFSGIDSFCSAHPGDMLWNAVKSVLTMSNGV